MDGLFLERFFEVAKDYPEIKATDINNLSLTKTQDKREDYQILQITTNGEEIVTGANFFEKIVERQLYLHKKLLL